uniref:Uncharacterized protein n=2 Tax=Chrysotila carterae TaxID=13221 RepID=A0A6S9S8H7_CHRCT
MWDGDAERLDELRAAERRSIYLNNACDGDARNGAARCEMLIKEALTKRSRSWSGSMFGVSGDATPAQRNPRMWAQSKRQAKEIMHDSATSRGLPPPKLRN